MMKLILIPITLLLLTGCAKPPAWVAEMYDRNDPCQRVELAGTDQYPRWCGGSGKRITIYNTQNRAIGYIK